MANSSCIREWKNKILSDLQGDDLILEVLDVSEEELDEGIIYKRLFPYYHIPDTTTEALTYILVEINIRSSTTTRYASRTANIYAYPTIVFTVLSHQSKMQLNLPGVSATRIDYLGELIDNKYNGKTGFGIGKLRLISNIADNLNADYRMRVLVFQGVDINDALCEV